jgi:hypothetical protein
MDNYLPIDQNPSLMRDISNHGVINVNQSQYNQYLNNKKLRDAEKESIQKIENDIDCLKTDLCFIKSLITKMYKNES